jgi:deazaflavin-dependent oxidoreductase (nitroreductase family)
VMRQQQLAPARAPLIVRIFDPLVRRLLAMGVPMGPNTLLTVPGRKTGLPRSAGVAIVEAQGRTWVMGAYGNVQWVRNLRHAGEGTIRVNGKQVRVKAHLLDADEASAFFRNVLTPYVGALPWIGQLTAAIIVGDMTRDPDAAARVHPVFELHRMD